MFVPFRSRRNVCAVIRAPGILGPPSKSVQRRKCGECGVNKQNLGRSCSCEHFLLPCDDCALRAVSWLGPCEPSWTVVSSERRASRAAAVRDQMLVFPPLQRSRGRGKRTTTTATTSRTRATATDCSARATTTRWQTVCVRNRIENNLSRL